MKADHFSLRVVDGSFSAGRSSSTRAGGVTLSAEVLKHSGEDHYVLRVNSRLITVRSLTPLRVGARLVVRSDDGGKALHLLAERTSTGMKSVGDAPVARIGVSPAETERPPTAVALSALTRAGMAVTEEALRVIERVMYRHRRSDPFFARIIAMLLDRGLPLEERFVAELVATFESEDDDDGTSRYRPRHADTNTGESAENPSDEEAFAADVRNEFSGNDQPGTPLHLFNHLRADHDTWQVVPYRIERSDWTATGSIRVRRGRDDRVDRLVLEIREGDEVSLCTVAIDAAGGRAYVPARNSPREIPERALLAEKLRNMGIVLDDTCSDRPMDGFSSEYPGSIEGFDALV